MTKDRTTLRLLAAGIVLLAIAASLLAAVPSHAATSSAIKRISPTGTVLKGDQVTLAGYFFSASGRTMHLETAPATKNTWTKLAGSTKKLPSTGKWTHKTTPTTTKRYRAVLPATATRARRVSAVLGVRLATGWRAVSTGRDHTCAVKDDRTAWCWGINEFGQLGNATNSGNAAAINAAPLKVATPVAGAHWASVSAGYQHSCGLLTDKTAWCWGSNQAGQLSGTAGSGGFTPQAPRKVTAGAVSTWKTIDASSWSSTCGITTAGALYCWGWSEYGQVGQPSGFYSTPMKVDSPVVGTTWRQVTTGTGHTCGILSDTSLWCFGSNQFGESGPGGVHDAGVHPTPIQVPGAWDQLDTNGSHTCGRLTSGAARCWGINTSGQLGSTTNLGTSTPTEPLEPGTPPLGQVRAITVGIDHSCAQRPDSTFWCWGGNERGQTTGRTPGPAIGPLAADVTWLQLTASNGITCGIRSDFQLLCAGRNNFGQLGRTTGTGVNDVNATLEVVAPPG